MRVAGGATTTFCLLAVMLSGCAPSLQQYEAWRPGAEDVRLCPVGTDSPVADSPRLFVCTNGRLAPPGEASNKEEAVTDVWWVINCFLTARPNYPDFRSLCALVNGYFQNWTRLVVLEIMPNANDIGHPGRTYGFVVLAETPGGPVAVTQLAGPETLPRYGTGKLRLLRVNRGALAKWFEEMDKAREDLPPALVYNAECMEVNPAALYEFRPGQKPWRCITYWGLNDNFFHDIVELPEDAATDAEVSQLFAGASGEDSGDVRDRWGDVIIEDPVRFRRVLNRYAALMIGFWEATIGRPRLEGLDSTVDFPWHLLGDFETEP